MYITLYYFAYLVCCCIYIEPYQFAAVCGERPDMHIAHQKHALHYILFHILHLAGLLALAYYHLYLLLRHLGFFVLESEQFQQPLCTFRQYPDKRSGYHRQDVHRVEHR